MAKGLGKGFEGLLPTNFDITIIQGEKDRVSQLLVHDVFPNPDQPRREFDQEQLEELASSIRRHGILQPLIVVKHTDGHRIVAGERRWRAAQLAGLAEVPAIVRTLEELEQLEIALIENVQRVDLSPLDQAASIYRLYHQFNIAYEDIALRLGKAVSTVNNITRLLQLPEPAQAALRANQISEGHARAILALKEYPHAQDFLLASILRLGWTVRQAEQYVTATKNGAKTATDAKKAAIDTTPQTKHLSKKLGTKVTIKRTAKGGSLQIFFRSEDELNTIFMNL